jgi:hypothetical protein
MDEDWNLLKSFFPKNWKKIGIQAGAMTRMRGFKTPENLIRTLLIHLSCGHSLRETVVRAKAAKIANISDVALLKRLQGCKNCFHQMCISLMEEQGISIPSSGIKCRLFDGTVVSEDGKIGTQWRIHYSMLVPSFLCDFFKLTKTDGKGNGETLKQYPIVKNDYIIADRGYSHPEGISHVNLNEAYILLRVNPYSLPLFETDKKKFPLLEKLGEITEIGVSKSWNVIVKSNNNSIQGRICVLRKTDQAILLAQKKLTQKSKAKDKKPQDATLEYAKYVILFTTFPEDEFTCHEILEWYRIRWQVELIFKRFKSITKLGQLPKKNDESSIAWLYGKLFVALITQKLINYTNFFSPWGYSLEKIMYSKQLA